MKPFVSSYSLKFLFSFIPTSFKTERDINILLSKDDLLKSRVCHPFPQLSVRISILSFATSENVFHANMYGNTRIYHIKHEMQSFTLRQKSTSIYVRFYQGDLKFHLIRKNSVHRITNKEIFVGLISFIV